MQWKWPPAVKFVPLKWLVLRLSWQPPKGASAYIHYWSLQEAASVKIRNPERRVLNMYHALVVIPRDFTPPTRRKVAFEGCFVWGRQVSSFSIRPHRSSQLQSLTLVCLLSSPPPCQQLLSPSVSSEIISKRGFRDSVFLSSPQVPWRRWPCHSLQIKLWCPNTFSSVGV